MVVSQTLFIIAIEGVEGMGGDRQWGCEGMVRELYMAGYNMHRSSNVCIYTYIYIFWM